LLLTWMLTSTASPALAQTSGTWTTTGSLTTARVNHAANVLQNGQVLVTGGDLASAEMYTPATGKWAPTGSTARFGDAVTLLPNG
jgi:hypothetical protein